jgi:two-component system NtrC family sensor kinase
MHPSAAGGAARAIRNRAVVHIPDVLSDPDYRIQEVALTAGFRALLGVPILSEGRAIGAITVGRADAPASHLVGYDQHTRRRADEVIE